MPKRYPAFERQGVHALLLAALLLIPFAASDSERVQSGEYWGLGSTTWLWIAIAVPVAHQVFVAVSWRAQLHGAWLTRIFGDRAFVPYTVVFLILLVSRPVAITLLAISNRGSVPLAPPLTTILVWLLAVPSIYLFYSVQRYFGFMRACGLDHFDANCRARPLVRKGIFRFTNNGMYVFGLLVLWIPGVLYGSAAALVGALFNHLYIWVHYHCTEAPDMKRIYTSVG